MVAVPKKKAKGATAQFVYKTLRQEILDLDIDPGALLDEVELTKRYGVSRSPIREALVRLSEAGLVETLPNRSAIAARLRAERLAPFLAAQELAFRVTAREAAKRITDDELQKLIQIQDDNDRARLADDMLAMIQTNRAFHMTIARISGNPWFESWLKSLMDEGQRLLKVYMRSLGNHVPTAELQWHHALLDALKDRDPEAADRAAKEDAQVVRAQLVAMLSGDPDATLVLD
jgi:DNA-binding GntR family transcriptional regulator